MNAHGEATVLRAAGLLGNTLLWKPAFTAIKHTRIRKVLNPNLERDFMILVEREGRKLANKSAPILKEFYEEILGRLDANWVDLPASHREAMLNSTIRLLDRRFPEEAIQEELMPTVGRSSKSTIKKSAAGFEKTHGLGRVFTWTSDDDEMVEIIKSSSTNYVRTINGQVSDSVSRLSRDVVAQGLKEGLSNEEIAHSLHRQFGETIGRTNLNYWRTVSSSYTGRSRSYGHLSSLDRAGFQRFQIIAVLDEVTTPTCRFLHGKRFSVGRGLGILRSIGELKQPEDIIYTQPWFRVKRSPEGLHSISVPHKTRGLVTVATETRSGYGTVDDTGEWDAKVSDPQLANLSVSPPPFHGGCRSTSVPVR